MSNFFIGTYNGTTVVVDEIGSPNGILDEGERIGILQGPSGAFVYDTATVDTFLRTIGVGGMAISGESTSGETFGMRPGADLRLLREHIESLNNDRKELPQSPVLVARAG